MKKIDLALLIGLVAAIFLTNFSSFAENYDALQGGVVRLHILANSDSDEDQTLKLKVRDELLAGSDAFFEDGKTFYETEKNLEARMDSIQALAQRVVYENGYDYTVECALVNMEFDARKYQGFTMPAGNYDALRVTIGEAKGHNWWCVMYPPLCIPAAEKPEELKDVFSEEEINILQNPQNFKFEFKCVEVYKKFKKWLEERKAA